MRAISGRSADGVSSAGIAELINIQPPRIGAKRTRTTPPRSQHHGANLSAAISVSPAPCAQHTAPCQSTTVARGGSHKNTSACTIRSAPSGTHAWELASARSAALFAPEPSTAASRSARASPARPNSGPALRAPQLAPASARHRRAHAVALARPWRQRGSRITPRACFWRRRKGQGSTRLRVPRRYARQRRWERTQPQSSRPAQPSGSSPRSQADVGAARCLRPVAQRRRRRAVRCDHHR